MKTVLLTPGDAIVVQVPVGNLLASRANEMCTAIKDKLQETFSNPIVVLSNEIELTVVRSN